MHQEFQNVKLIACDIDGTLLYNGTMVSDQTKNALDRIQNETNIHITLATGREFFSATEVQNMLGLKDGPLICNNGAIVREKEDVFFSATLPKQLPYDILNFANQHDLFLLLFAPDKTYCYAATEEKIDMFFASFKMSEKRREMSFAIFHNAEELAALPFDVFNKVCLFSIYPTLEEVQQHLQESRTALAQFLHEYGYTQDCYITSSHWNNCELMPIGITKATGLQVLADHYGLSFDEIMVFGDNENDIEMLQEIPKSFAMGNASDIVKQAASYITDTVENGGVGIALETYLLN